MTSTAPERDLGVAERKTMGDPERCLRRVIEKGGDYDGISDSLVCRIRCPNERTMGPDQRLGKGRDPG